MYDRLDIERFWACVDSSGGAGVCWPWTAGKTGRGYGAFTVAGRQHKAHRLAYELACGPIPVGMFVCHHCDNPPCCNPEHLYAGTATDNNRDTVRRGRHKVSPIALAALIRSNKTRPKRPRIFVRKRKVGPGKARGERVNTARLTATDVRTIRAAAAAGESGPSIARRYRLARETVRLIIRRETWKHID